MASTRIRNTRFRHHLRSLIAVLLLLQCAQQVKAERIFAAPKNLLLAELPTHATSRTPALLLDMLSSEAKEEDVRVERRIKVVRQVETLEGNLATLVDGTEGTQWTKFDKVVIAHAAVGSVAWMIISPAAILLAKASTSALRAHTIAQALVTSGLTIVAVVLGIVATAIGPSGGHFQSAHQQMGLVLLLLLCLQLLLGRLIKARQHVDIRVRPISNIVHIVLGIALTAIGFAQISLGMDLYEEKTGRSVPRAVKIVWGITIGLFSAIFVAISVLKASRQPSKTSMKEKLQLQKRKATVHFDKHKERGIRSDGLWVGMMDQNISSSTFVSNYTDYSVFSEASKDPGPKIHERTLQPPVDTALSMLWLDALEKNMPVHPSTMPVFQPSVTYSSRAPASDADLNLPSTPVSPLVPIFEEEEEAYDFPYEQDPVEEEGRPHSWMSSGATSMSTELSSHDQRSRTRSIKRKPVPQLQ